jgi:IS30 family transposase
VSYKRLTYKDRKLIEQLDRADKSAQEIAEAVGVSPSTIYNELKRGSVGEMDENGRIGYIAEFAQRSTLQIAANTREKHSFLLSKPIW